MVILDDKFGSIVRAIMWGRAVYDNIRKFLQFQLTVNVVALLLVFIGAVAGFGQPLNALMMLWVSAYTYAYAGHLMHIKQLYFTLRPVTVIISCMIRTYTAPHRTISLSSGESDYEHNGCVGLWNRSTLSKLLT